MAREERIAERDRVRVKNIRRVTWVGLWLNVVLCTFKITAGIFGNSRAVVADGVHSLSDLMADVGMLVGGPAGKEPVDGRDACARRRLESTASLAVGVLLAAAGIGIAYNALTGIGRQGGGPAGSLLALCAALTSVVSKELLYRWTERKGEELRSDALEAGAWDHRLDAISSVPTALAVAVAMWVPGCAFVDLLGAAVVSLFILYAAWRMCASAVRALDGGGNDPAACGKIKEFTLRLPDVRDVRNLCARSVGQGLRVDMQVDVDASLTVRQGSDVALAVEDALYTAEAGEFVGTEIFEVLVHIAPWTPGSAEDLG